MKNIFIPSDFSNQSLEIIRTFVSRFKTQKFNMILFHTLYTPDSITDLLFISRKNQEVLNLSREFTLQCKALKNTFYPQIHDINQVLIYGSTNNIFKQYLQANNIHCIVWQPTYKLNKLSKNSFDPRALIQDSGIELIDIEKEWIAENVSHQLVKQIKFSQN